MPVQATVEVTALRTWTALNASNAASGNVSLYNRGESTLMILVSTSPSPPTYNAASLDDAFEMKPGDAIIGTTCALLAPGLTAPTWLYACPRGGYPGRILVSCA